MPLEDLILPKHSEPLEKEARLAGMIRSRGLDKEGFIEGAAYFGVSRTLPGIQGKAEDLAKAVTDSLEGWRPPSELCEARESVSDKVDEVAVAFSRLTGRLAISAASKMLWLSYGDPFRIYDERGRRALSYLTGRPMRQDYCAFLKDWEQEFGVREAEFQSVAENLDLSSWPHWEALPAVEGSALRSELAARLFDKWLFEQGG